MTANRPRAPLFPRRTGFPGQIFCDSIRSEKILLNPKTFNSKSNYSIRKEFFRFEISISNCKPGGFNSKSKYSIRKKLFQFEKKRFNSKNIYSIPNRKIQFDLELFNSKRIFPIRKTNIQFDLFGSNSKIPDSIPNGLAPIGKFHIQFENLISN
jgi:hypothetical protein